MNGLKRKFVVLILFLGSYGSMHCQKVVKKSLVDRNTSLIQIDANSCYDIQIRTSDVHEVVVEAIIDGEYRDDLLIRVEESGSTLLISAGFQPSFLNPNDKLSAHKIVSISLTVLLPEQKHLQVFGTNCNIGITGNYQDLKVTLADGQCILDHVSGIAEITTLSGNITVNGNSGTIAAKSKFGKVLKDSIPTGNDHFNLNTTTGNIRIRKTK